MPKRTHAQRKPSEPSRRKSRLSWILIIGGVLVVAGIIAAIFIFRPKANNSAQASGLPSEISVKQAYEQYQQGVFFLDVRTQEEWNAFHIPGATLIPLDELAGRLDEVPRDRQVVVVCRSGNRSRSGRDILLNAGFTQVTSLTGGLTAWSNAGYPIEGTRP